MNKLRAIWSILLSRGFLLFTDDGYTTSAIPTDEASRQAMIDSAERYINFIEELQKEGE